MQQKKETSAVDVADADHGDERRGGKSSCLQIEK